jgi:hypothetical protein
MSAWAEVFKLVFERGAEFRFEGVIVPEPVVRDAADNSGMFESVPATIPVASTISGN